MRTKTLPLAISTAETRIAFKLEILEMLQARIDRLDREKQIETPSKRAQTEAALVELRGFKLDVQAIEFQVSTRKRT